MTYRGAIEETATTIRLRARLYRNLVVAVVLVTISTILFAVTLKSGRVLLSSACIIPICGLFLARDGQLFGRWRASMLSAWTRRDLDFTALLVSLRASPTLPAATLEGMCMTLPTCPSLMDEQQLAVATRKAIAADFLCIQREQMNAVWIRVAYSALAVAAAFVIAFRHLEVLGAVLVAGCSAVGIRRYVRQIQNRCCAREIASCRADPTFNENAYRRIIATVHRGHHNE